MKAGLVMAFHALAGLDERDGVTLLVTGDEEIGSPTSRAPRSRTRRGCAGAALVLEASADGGALKTERKGVSLYDVRDRAAAPRTPASSRSAASTRPSSWPTRLLAVAGARRRRPRHHGDAHGVAAPAPPPTPCPPKARSPSTSASGPSAEQERVDAALRALRAVVPGAALEIARRPQPAAAGGRGVGGAVRPRASPGRSGSVCRRSTAAAVGGALRRQLHRRRRHADPRRPRRRRRRRPRRRRARAGRRASRSHRAARRAGRGPAGAPDACSRDDGCPPTMTDPGSLDTRRHLGRPLHREDLHAGDRVRPGQREHPQDRRVRRGGEPRAC